MEFDKSRVYTALNADELKVGSNVIVADTIDSLKQYVEHNCDTSIIEDIMPGYYSERFNCGNRNYNLAYLVSEPEEKKLKWTDLKIGDIVCRGKLFWMVTGIDARSDTTMHIHFNDSWYNDSELEDFEKVE